VPVASSTTAKTAFRTVSGNEKNEDRNNSESEVGDDFEALLFYRAGVSPDQGDRPGAVIVRAYWQRLSIAVQLQ
jgi:hypothetical protein